LLRASVRFNGVLPGWLLLPGRVCRLEGVRAA